MGGTIHFFSLTTGEISEGATYAETGNGYSKTYRACVDNGAGVWTVAENTDPVPEPANMLLLGLGLIGLVGVRRKFKK